MNNPESMYNSGAGTIYRHSRNSDSIVTPPRTRSRSRTSQPFSTPRQRTIYVAEPRQIVSIDLDEDLNEDSASMSSIVTQPNSGRRASITLRTSIDLDPFQVSQDLFLHNEDEHALLGTPFRDNTIDRMRRDIPRTSLSLTRGSQKMCLTVSDNNFEDDGTLVDTIMKTMPKYVETIRDNQSHDEQIVEKYTELESLTVSKQKLLSEIDALSQKSITLKRMMSAFEDKEQELTRKRAKIEKLRCADDNLSVRRKKFEKESKVSQALKQIFDNALTLESDIKNHDTLLQTLHEKVHEFKDTEFKKASEIRSLLNGKADKITSPFSYMAENFFPCKICYSLVRGADIGFLSCNHIVCVSCLSTVRTNLCPYCRAEMQVLLLIDDHNNGNWKFVMHALKIEASGNLFTEVGFAPTNNGNYRCLTRPAPNTTTTTTTTATRIQEEWL